MSPEERRFEIVLEELRALWIAFQDISWHMTLIGGQVVSLLSKQRSGTALIEVTFPTGPSVSRGYSFEPDILVDLDGIANRADQIDDVLRQRGYTRVRGHRWARTVHDEIGEVAIEVDLFRPDDTQEENNYSGLTAIRADQALARRQTINLRGVAVHIPDALGFISMKIDAKQRYRPDETRDCLDIVAYVALVGAAEVAAQLENGGPVGEQIRRDLKELFGSVESRGVRDVLAHELSADPYERELLAQAVVDLMQDLT